MRSIIEWYTIFQLEDDDEFKEAHQKGNTNKRNTCLNECNKYLFSFVRIRVFLSHLIRVCPKKKQRKKTRLVHIVFWCVRFRMVAHMWCRCSTAHNRSHYQPNEHSNGIGRKMTFDLVDVRTRVNFHFEIHRRRFVVIKSMGSRSFSIAFTHSLLVTLPVNSSKLLNTLVKVDL